MPPRLAKPADPPFYAVLWPCRTGICGTIVSSVCGTTASGTTGPSAEGSWFCGGGSGSGRLPACPPAALALLCSALGSCLRQVAAAFWPCALLVSEDPYAFGLLPLPCLAAVHKLPPPRPTSHPALFWLLSPTSLRLRVRRRQARQPPAQPHLQHPALAAAQHLAGSGPASLVLHMCTGKHQRRLLQLLLPGSQRVVCVCVVVVVAGGSAECSWVIR